jgi:hypothetical protein
MRDDASDFCRRDRHRLLISKARQVCLDKLFEGATFLSFAPLIVLRCAFDVVNGAKASSKQAHGVSYGSLPPQDFAHLFHRGCFEAF